MGAAAQLANHDLYSAIASIVSARVRSRDVREDVIGDMIVAVLAGEIAPNEIENSAKKFIRRHFSLFDPFKHVSIDAPRRDGGSWHDIIATSDIVLPPATRHREEVQIINDSDLAEMRDAAQSAARRMTCADAKGRLRWWRRLGRYRINGKNRVIWENWAVDDRGKPSFNGLRVSQA